MVGFAGFSEIINSIIMLPATRPPLILILMLHKAHFVQVLVHVMSNLLMQE